MTRTPAFQVSAGLEVSSLGLTIKGEPPDKVFVDVVQIPSWAAEVELRKGFEILCVNGCTLESFTRKEVNVKMRERPLFLKVQPPPNEIRSGKDSQSSKSLLLEPSRKPTRRPAEGLVLSNSKPNATQKEFRGALSGLCSAKSPPPNVAQLAVVEDESAKIQKANIARIAELEQKVQDQAEHSKTAEWQANVKDRRGQRHEAAISKANVQIEEFEQKMQSQVKQQEAEMLQANARIGELEQELQDQVKQQEAGMIQATARIGELEQELQGQVEQQEAATELRQEENETKAAAARDEAKAGIARAKQLNMQHEAAIAELEQEATAHIEGLEQKLQARVDELQTQLENQAFTHKNELQAQVQTQEVAQAEFEGVLQAQKKASSDELADRNLKADIEAKRIAAQHEEATAHIEELEQKLQAGVDELADQKGAETLRIKTWKENANSTIEDLEAKLESQEKANAEKHEAAIAELEQEATARIEKLESQKKANEEKHKAELQAQALLHSHYVWTQSGIDFLQGEGLFDEFSQPVVGGLVPASFGKQAMTKGLAELKADAHEEEMRAQEKAFNEKLVSQADAHEEKLKAEMQAQEKAHSEKLESQEKANAEKHEAAIAELEQEAHAHIEIFQETLEAELKAQEKAHSEKLESQEKANAEQHEAAIAELEQEATAHIENQADAHEKKLKAELQAQDTAHSEKLESQEKANVKAHNELEEKHIAELQIQVNAHSDDKSKLELKHKAELKAQEEAQVEAHRDDKSKLEEKHRLEVSKLHGTVAEELFSGDFLAELKLPGSVHKIEEMEKEIEERNKEIEILKQQQQQIDDTNRIAALELQSQERESLAIARNRISAAIAKEEVSVSLLAAVSLLAESDEKMRVQQSEEMENKIEILKQERIIDTNRIAALELQLRGTEDLAKHQQNALAEQEIEIEEVSVSLHAEFDDKMRVQQEEYETKLNATALKEQEDALANAELRRKFEEMKKKLGAEEKQRIVMEEKAKEQDKIINEVHEKCAQVQKDDKKLVVRYRLEVALARKDVAQLEQELLAETNQRKTMLKTMATQHGQVEEEDAICMAGLRDELAEAKAIVAQLEKDLHAETKQRTTMAEEATAHFADSAAQAQEEHAKCLVDLETVIKDLKENSAKAKASFADSAAQAQEEHAKCLVDLETVNKDLKEEHANAQEEQCQNLEAVIKDLKEKLCAEKKQGDALAEEAKAEAALRRAELVDLEGVSKDLKEAKQREEKDKLILAEANFTMADVAQLQKDLHAETKRRQDLFCEVEEATARLAEAATRTALMEKQCAAIEEEDAKTMAGLRGQLAELTVAAARLAEVADADIADLEDRHTHEMKQRAAVAKEDMDALDAKLAHATSQLQAEREQRVAVGEESNEVFSRVLLNWEEEKAADDNMVDTTLAGWTKRWDDRASQFYLSNDETGEKRSEVFSQFWHQKLAHATSQLQAETAQRAAVEEELAELKSKSPQAHKFVWTQSGIDFLHSESLFDEFGQPVVGSDVPAAMEQQAEQFGLAEFKSNRTPSPSAQTVVPAAMEQQEAQLGLAESEANQTQDCRPCASTGCHFQVTWHATNCCGVCANTSGEHGPRCDKKPMPEEERPEPEDVAAALPTLAAPDSQPSSPPADVAPAPETGWPKGVSTVFPGQAGVESEDVAAASSPLVAPGSKPSWPEGANATKRKVRRKKLPEESTNGVL